MTRRPAARAGSGRSATTRRPCFVEVMTVFVLPMLLLLFLVPLLALLLVVTVAAQPAQRPVRRRRDD